MWEVVNETLVEEKNVLSETAFPFRSRTMPGFVFLALDLLQSSAHYTEETS